MSKLKELDNKAEGKGSLFVTIWQFVKFIVVSLAAFAIQFGLPMIIELFMSDEFLAKEFSFLGGLFASSSKEVDGVLIVSGLGIFLASTISNILAQIVAFFINKEKTFNSSKSISKTLPIYLAFIVGLIIFSAWLTPTITGLFMGFGLAPEPASGIGGAICGMIQFFVLFPVEKILFSEKKKKEN